MRDPAGGSYPCNNEETLENNVSIFRLAFILSGSPKYGISSYVISVEEPDKMKANLIITLFSSVSSLWNAERSSNSSLSIGSLQSYFPTVTDSLPYNETCSATEGEAVGEREGWNLTIFLVPVHL
jgi:hypothetical protein